jgi:CBS domain-containing protein
MRAGAPGRKAPRSRRPALNSFVAAAARIDDNPGEGIGGRKDLSRGGWIRRRLPTGSRTAEATMNLTAKDVMTTHVLAVRADWPISQLADFLVEHSISGAPVVSEGGRLVGVVSMTDIVRYESMPVNNPKPAGPHSYYLQSLELQYAEEEVSSFRIGGDSPTAIEDIMTPVLFKVTEDTPLPKIADTMIKGRIHRLLVTRGEEIVGIVSALDVLKVIRDM